MILVTPSGVRQPTLPMPIGWVNTTCGSPFFGRREVEDAHRRDVDDEPAARRVRQDELRGHDDLGALARQPGVDPGVGAHDLLVADVEAPRDVGERVVLGRP